MAHIYDERRALTILSRAARTDGRKPPMNPIASAKRRKERIIEGESANENAPLLQKREASAFVSLYEKYKGPSYLYCLLLLRDQQLTEDATDDTLLKIEAALSL
jgi:hypothetical protein